MMTLTAEELKKAQFLMLKILKEVHRVCEENNIHYFLSDGTLIGAVRHNGFIPWDDDLDIGMLRADYEKFCEIAPKFLGDEYLLQNNTIDKGYGLQFAKVILKDTLWIETSAENTKREYSGLYIDIFPYDKVPYDVKIQKKHYKKYYFTNALIFIKLKYNTFKRTKGLFRKLYFIYKWIISRFCSLDSLLQKRRALCTKFEKLSSDFVVTKYGGNFYKNQEPYDSYSILLKHVFEDASFYIPEDYDTILSNLYGNYMELPPPEKRLNHGIKEFNFGMYK